MTDSTSPKKSKKVVKKVTKVAKKVSRKPVLKKVENKVSSIEKNVFYEHDADAILRCFKNPYLFFNNEGIVSKSYHYDIPDIVELDNPEFMSILEILKVEVKERVNYGSWISLMFNETISFEEAAELGPAVFKHSDESKHIRLDYRAVRNPKGRISSILVLFKDESSIYKRNMETEEREKRSKFLLKAFTFKTQFVDFIAELKMVIFRLREFGNTPTPDNLLEAKRLLHTLTGATSYFHLLQLEDVCRSTENAIRTTDPARKTELAKIFLSACLKFNELYQNLYREYSPVLGKPAFNNQISREVPLKKLELFYEKLVAGTSNEDIQVEFLNEFVKIPLSQLFTHFEGVIQDTANLLAKKVKPLRITGDHVLVFEEPYKHLFASFIHIFNNVMDHGIEDPYTRQKMGKPMEGLITVEIKKDQEDFIEIIIGDDGRGIDVDLIKRKLEINAINYTFLSDEEILQTVFLPDFSTKDDIGKFSGRGIGLNALADELEKIGGSVNVQSRPGLGVTFHIQIPVLRLDGQPV